LVGAACCEADRVHRIADISFVVVIIDVVTYPIKRSAIYATDLTGRYE
jgi:hypothetical protein